MSTIHSNARPVRLLLARTKYELDYYQREYSWQTKHVVELIDDLANKFLGYYEIHHARPEVEGYGDYFLGSIIIVKKQGVPPYIVDGQQRLTTLTLLLINLNHWLGDRLDRPHVSDLILSQTYGQNSFNLDIEERNHAMEALYADSDDRVLDQLRDNPAFSESVRNIIDRYNDIKENFPEELKGNALPYFVDWLINKVYLVEISTDSDGDAYTIFETMNDRGLSLRPTDMLRGHLLSKIDEGERRNHAGEIWRDQIQTLQRLGKEEDSEAIKAWLRSQYGNTVDDFKTIGAEFHRWVRDSEIAPNLKSGDDFVNFIQRDFAFYSRWYYRLQAAAKTLKPGLECVHYNAQNNFTLQYPVLLAPLCVDDTDKEVLTKIGIGATYLDILIHRRIWNRLDISQRAMVHLLCPVIPVIRGKSSQELSGTLCNWLEANETNAPAFAKNRSFHLYGGNRRKIRLILARLTDYVEVQSGMPSRYSDYVKTGKNEFEVEHIWANYPQRHRDEFPQSADFEAYRDRIGGLLLLPKKKNASYSDLPYAEKRNHYLKDNLLAQSLHEGAYERNPGFLQFIEESGLPFQDYPEFKKADLDARQRLYQHLAEQIWSPERLLGEDPPPFSPPPEEPYDPDPPPVPGLADPGLDERTRSEVREFYSGMSASKVSQLCERVVELHRLIEEEGWELTRKFNQSYCAFYLGNRRVFGVSFFAYPRLAAWITKAEAENLSCHSNFESYYDLHRHAVYPQGTTVDQLRPIFEFAYRKYRGN